MNLVPAYGRDYTSQSKVRADWQDGKDFKISEVGPNDGRYCSIREVDQLKANGVTRVQIRYANLAKVMTINL